MVGEGKMGTSAARKGGTVGPGRGECWTLHSHRAVGEDETSTARGRNTHTCSGISTGKERDVRALQVVGAHDVTTLGEFRSMGEKGHDGTCTALGLARGTKWDLC